jgi:hypothetical protein
VMAEIGPHKKKDANAKTRISASGIRKMENNQEARSQMASSYGMSTR